MYSQWGIMYAIHYYNLLLIPKLLFFITFHTAIRLVKDGHITNLPEGRVEVVYNGQWGRICGDGWDINDANVLCKQLYNSSAESVSTDINSGPSMGILSNFECDGDEQNIFECPHMPWGKYNCTLPDAAVVCRGE